METPANYIPALRFHFLTPFFDSFQRWVMREFTFKRRLLLEARITAGERVLDLGCGTATLSIMLKQARPDASVVGIDGDSQVLAIARAKAAQEGVNITFDEGMAFRLPYADQSFDRVLSSLVFHHLTPDDKQRALDESFRILRPGGELLILDLGGPHGFYARIISPLAWLEQGADLVKGCLPEMFRRAGFQDAGIITRFSTAVGTLALYRGRKPESKSDSQ